MKIIYRTGNLLDAPERHVCHQTNCRGKMAKGLAKQIRDRFPQAYTAYMDAYARGECKLGKTIWADCGKKTIIHAMGQDRYGNDGGQYTDYDAFRECIRQIDAVCAMTQRIENATHVLGVIDTIAFPFEIGCKLGGGSWDIVSRIIEEESICFQPVVYKFEG